jgi:hypothetical protein
MKDDFFQTIDREYSLNASMRHFNQTGNLVCPRKDEDRRVHVELWMELLYCITVDSATPASQYSACTEGTISKQMCHTTALSRNCSKRTLEEKIFKKLHYVQ